MRSTALFPLACCIVGFVLSILCLYAGDKRNFMEEYHIITLNASTLGHDLIDKANSASASSTATSSTAKPTATGLTGILEGIGDNITSSISGEIHNATSTIEGDLDGILNNLADKLAQTLGIKQWYSLHMMDHCEGTYAPNATEKGAHLNVTTCSNDTSTFGFDIKAIINQQLESGPLHINISDLDFPDQIQDGLNALATAFNATFIIYCIGIAAAGIAIITAALAFFMRGSRLVSFFNWGLTSLSFTALLISSIIITVVMKKAANLINKYGNDIGLYAYKGGKFLTLTWIAVAMMGVASLCWVGEFCVGRRNSNREFTEKTSGRGQRKWWGRPRRSDEAALRRSGV